MATRPAAILCIAALLSSRSAAQDSLRAAGRDILREITSSREPESAVIAKARTLLLDCVKTDDTAKGKPVLRFVLERYRQTRYLPFWPAEEYLLSFWAGEYRRMLDPAALEGLDTLQYASFVVPPRDLLLDDLRDALAGRQPALRDAIIHAPFREHESAFLLLFLETLLADRHDPVAQKTLNEDADDFLARFGDSPYAPFVRRDIRSVVVESRIGYGFSIGGGASTVTGRLGGLLSAGGAFDLGGELGIRKLIGDLDAVVYGRLTAGIGGKVRSAFSYRGDWVPGDKKDILVPEISLGIVAFETDFVQCTPFAGLSGVLISPPTDANGNSSDGPELNMFSWSAGLSVDWKIGAREIAGSPSYLYIRTRLTYSSPFPQPETRFNGGFLAFTVDFGGFWRPLIRDF